MKTFMLLVVCVLSCFCSKFALCDVVEQEGTSMISPQCLDINMQVEKAIYDIGTVTEKNKGFQDGIQISLDYNSSASYSYHSGADKAKTLLQWISWPFQSLANTLSVLFNFLVETASKVLGWVAWPFTFLKNQTVPLYEIVAGVCSSLNQKIKKQSEDSIIIIEAVLEVIWMVVSPFIRAVIWLCEIIITVKRYIELKTASHPAVIEYITTYKMIGEYLSKLLALWPWNWLDSIEYVGYTWAIVYFSFSLIKLSMMDEREMLRLARHSH